MAKAPWFPFYTGDFLASTDVQLMEAHEVGAYILLLAHSWQSDTPGMMPNDEGRMRRLARLSAEQWKESHELLLSKWPVDEFNPTTRCNPRLLREAKKQVEIRELKAEAGRKSAERRAANPTQGQQKPNTNPTGVEIKSTGDGQNGNYSQSQPQSHTTDVVEGNQTPSYLNKGKDAALANTDPDDEIPWDKGPLTRSKSFQVICERLGFENIDFKHYRKQALVAAEDAKISRTITQWTSWIRNYFNNQLKSGPLLKVEAGMPTEETPHDQWAAINASGGVIAFKSDGDAYNTRMRKTSYEGSYPNATFHVIEYRR